MDINTYYREKIAVIENDNLPEKTKEDLKFRIWWTYIQTNVLKQRIEYVVNPPKLEQPGMLFFCQPETRAEQIAYLIGKIKQRFMKRNPCITQKRYSERMEDFVSSEIWKFIRPEDSSIRGFKRRNPITSLSNNTNTNN